MEKSEKINTILVTGNAGFIGSHLNKALLDKSYRVIGVDNFNDYYNPKFKEENVKELANNENFKQYRVDIVNIEKLEKVFQDSEIDLIVHLAARAGVRPSLENPQLYERVNVQGTKNLLQMTEKFKINRFIFGSSSSVYGIQKKIPFSENDVLQKPVSPYAETKLKGEKLCQKYAEKYGINMTILRFFTVYGPKGRPDMAPYLFTKALMKDKTIIKFGDGSSSRDYTYVDDIVAGIIQAIEKPFKFEIFNLGNNNPVSLNDFIALVEKLTDKKAKIEIKDRHPADVPKTYADISKAKKLLNWQPETDLETGMKKFVEWYINQRKT